MKASSYSFIILILIMMVTGCSGNGPKIRKEMKSDALTVYNDIEVMMRHGEVNTNYNGAQLFSEKYKSSEETDDERQLSILISDLELAHLDYEKAVLLNDFDGQTKATSKFAELSSKMKTMIGS